MPYIGRELDSGNYLKLDDISSSFNGSTTTFNLTAGGKAFFPGSAFSILVNLAGVAQEPEAAYQINNSQITFATAPASGDQFYCIVLGVAHGVNVPGNGTVDGAQLAKPFNYDGYFYLDDANNRVGVGTATPSKPLHVVGEGQFDSVRVLGDLTVDGTTTTLDTVVTEVDRLEVGANNNTVGLAVTQSGSGHAAIFMGGKVGVGVASPTVPLTVSSSADHSDIAIFHAGGGTPNRGLKISTFSNTNSNAGVEFDAQFSTGAFKFSTGGTERLRITSDGKIGVGTNNPTGDLTISKANGSIITLQRDDTSTAGNRTIGEIVFRGNDNSGSFQDCAKIRAISDKGHSDDDKPTNLEFYTTPDNSGTSVERFRITSEGLIGIGTDSPQSQFEVYGTSPIVRSKHSTSQKYTQINHNGTDGYLDWSSGGLIFRGASNTERLRITSDGKVGIGINNPGDNLEIKTDAHGEGLTVKSTGSTSNAVTFDANRSGGGQSISNVYGRWNGTTVAQMGFVTGVDATNKNDGYIYFGTESDASNGNVNATERLRIAADGNVGVGNADPTQARLVAQTASGMSIAAIKDNTGASISLGGVTQPRILMESDASASVFKLYTAGGSSYGSAGWVERLRVTSDGKVGVGAVNPQATLQIGAGFDSGNSQRHGTLLISADNSLHNYIRFTNGGATETHYPSGIWYQPSGRMELRAALNSSSSNAAQLVLASNGSVGVGTESPTGNFEVNGNDGINISNTNRTGTNGAQWRLIPSSGGSNTNAATNLRLYEGAGAVEVLNIQKAGQVMLGHNELISHPNMDDLQIGDASGNRGITICSGTSSYGTVAFGDSTDGSGGDRYTGFVEYYHGDNSMRLGTNSGEKVRIDSSGNIGINNSAPLYAMHFKNAMGSSPSFIHMEVTGSNVVGGGGGIAFDTSASNNASNNTLYLATIAGIRNSSDDGSNDLVFSTTKATVNSNLPVEKLRITSAGDVLPGADATQDLGSATKRWANIHSADLQLSNEGAANDVDGTWGQYTIQEGEDDLFLINRRNGKKYKFMLQEVN